MKCVFCSIIDGTIKADILHEEEDFIVIRDINPVAKQHLLVIPKRHFAYLSELTDDDAAFEARVLRRLPVIAQKAGVTGGYRVVINQGENAGQSVFHLHIHIIGGEKLGHMA